MIDANIALNGYWVDEIFVIIWFWMLTLKALDDSKLYWEQEQFVFMELYNEFVSIMARVLNNES